MILDIAVDGTPTLVDADNCNAFHIAGHRPAPASQPHDELEITQDGSHTLVAPTLIERLASGQVGDDWPQRFEAMLAYAATKGWLDDAGRITGHCEWTGGT